MSRPILWRSSNGRMTINLCSVASVYTQTDGELLIYTAGERAIDGVKVRQEDAESFLAALDAAAAPAPTHDTVALDKVAATVESIRAMTMADESATYADRQVVAALADIVTLLRRRP